jgi:hypothetical protein
VANSNVAAHLLWRRLSFNISGRPAIEHPFTNILYSCTAFTIEHPFANILCSCTAFAIEHPFANVLCSCTAFTNEYPFAIVEDIVCFAIEYPCLGGSTTSLSGGNL